MALHASPSCLVEGLWAQSERTPDALAVVFTAEDGGFRERSIPFRYVWPSELDLMARIAGMRLRDRWAGWHAEPFTAESSSHVSVWEKPV